MQAEFKLPTELETMPIDYWFPKFVISVLFLLAAPMFLSLEHPLSAVIVILFVLAGFLLLSITRVKPELESVKYRRFFRWKSMSYSEVNGCYGFWILGFLSADSYIFPWGPAIFVLPRSRETDLRWDKNIISFIKHKISAARTPTQENARQT
jgi:hypothetical protein